MEIGSLPGAKMQRSRNPLTDCESSARRSLPMNGASAHELMTQFGWLKVEQAETCTRKADRKRLGVKSFGRVADQMENTISRTEKQVRGKSKKMQ